MLTKELLLIAGLVCMTGSTPPFGTRPPPVPGWWFWILGTPDNIPSFIEYVESKHSPDLSIPVEVYAAWKQKMTYPFGICEVVLRAKFPLPADKDFLYVDCIQFPPWFGMAGPMSPGIMGQKKI